MKTNNKSDSSGVQQPRQARSAETLNKVLDACDRLLADRAFEQISMQDIAREAGVSVGNLYNRFTDRDALIDHIINRHQGEFREFMASALEGQEKGLPLFDRVSVITDTFLIGLANLRPVFATLVTRSLKGIDPDETSRDGTNEIIELAVSWLCQQPNEIPGDSASRARFAVASIAFAMQYDLLLGTATRMFGEDYMAKVKTQAYHYLIHPEETRK
jgi:AcrR family transcriptional regulator